jgi:ethanolamine utilization protein EutP (predicted NTPase)
MKKTAFIEHPNITYDPSLDDEEKNNPNPFPEKMALAIATIEKYGLPPHIKRTKKAEKALRYAQQTEVLTVFSVDPTEKQMQQLKDFLHQLFGEGITKLEVKQRKKIAA